MEPTQRPYQLLLSLSIKKSRLKPVNTELLTDAPLYPYIINPGYLLCVYSGGMFVFRCSNCFNIYADIPRAVLSDRLPHLRTRERLNKNEYNITTRRCLTSTSLLKHPVISMQSTDWIVKCIKAFICEVLYTINVTRITYHISRQPTVMHSNTDSNCKTELQISTDWMTTELNGQTEYVNTYLSTVITHWGRGTHISVAKLTFLLFS